MEGLSICEPRRLCHSCGSGELFLHPDVQKTGHDPSQSVDVVGNGFPGIGGRRFCRASTSVISAFMRLRRPNVLYFFRRRSCWRLIFFDFAHVLYPTHFFCALLRSTISNFVQRLHKPTEIVRIFRTKCGYCSDFPNKNVNYK